MFGNAQAFLNAMRTDVLLRYFAVQNGKKMLVLCFCKWKGSDQYELRLDHYN